MPFLDTIVTNLSFLQWALVIAGISDFNRPPEKLSLTQNFALMGTGAIWTRWCFIIKPRNLLYVSLFDLKKNPTGVTNCRSDTSYSLAAVNFFLGCVGLVQVSRIFLWQRSQEGSSMKAAKQLEHEAVESVKAVASEVESTAKTAGKKSS